MLWHFCNSFCPECDKFCPKVQKREHIFTPSPVIPHLGPLPNILNFVRHVWHFWYSLENSPPLSARIDGTKSSCTPSKTWFDTLEVTWLYNVLTLRRDLTLLKSCDLTLSPLIRKECDVSNCPCSGASISRTWPSKQQTSKTLRSWNRRLENIF